MSDQEQEDTDTTSEDTTDEETTFQIGDYKTFTMTVFKYLMMLFVVLTVGFHILYSCRHEFDDFMNEYFPTDNTKSPFCHTKDMDCKRSFFYPDTTVEVKKYINGSPTMVNEPYHPEFNIDITKKTNITTGETTIEGKYDEEIWYWIKYWFYNTFIKMNIINNEIYKFIYEFIHNNVTTDTASIFNSLVVFLGFKIMFLFFIFVMPYVTILTFIYAGCNAYNDKYSWILMFPIFGFLYLAITHLFKRNSFQCLMSLMGGIPLGFMLHMISGLCILFSMGLPVIKFIRIYVTNFIMMIYNLIRYVKYPVDDKYSKMISYFSEFSMGIFIIIAIIVLKAAYTNLVYPIFIGMTLCSIYLLFTSYFSKKE